MKRYFYTIAALALLFTQACKKSLEVSPLKLTNNEVSLSLGATSFSSITLDSLKIVPQITESKPEGHKFSYSWMVWPNGGNDVQEISKTRDLKIKMTLAPQAYRMRFAVKDENTGISYFTDAFLDVSTIFDEGWLVTHNSGGKGHLGFIRTSNDLLVLSPIEDVNKKTYDEGISAFAASHVFNSTLHQTIYFTKSGAFRLDSKSFGELGNSTQLFDEPVTAFGTDAYYGADGFFLTQLIINNGNLYHATGNGASTKFTSRLPGDYTAFPYLFLLGTSVPSDMVIYDNKSKGFKRVDKGTIRVIDLIGTGGFSLTNVGRRMIGADVGPNTEYLCVMKDDNTARFYMNSLLGKGTSSVFAGISQEMLNCPDLGTATAFTTSSKVRVMYYGSGNKIYLYDVNANSAKLVYTFPAGYTIKDMRMFKEQPRQIATISSPLLNSRLVVGVQNGQNGEVYYLDLNGVGEVLNNTFSKKFTGFGNIVHLSYRSIY